jgi:D-arabinose 1-dehydrogenase-like Zn-dependent alcohol dehydrogenase
MRAMMLREISPIETKPLKIVDLPLPKPNLREILVEISVCGICHTELDEIEGRIILNKLPIVIGHQIAGIVAESRSEKYKKNDCQAGKRTRHGDAGWDDGTTIKGSRSKG